MRTTSYRKAFLLLPFSIVAVQAAPIQNLTFTEVIKDVFVIDPGTKQETPAKAGDKLVPPNVLKTGADSRAELVAEDKTVTRVGSNTIFSVEANSRDVNLAQGSVLFHSPAGRGGGRIKSAGATASVLGTTLAVSANSDGGFKTSLLEGKGEVKDPKGGKVGLVAGQVTFAKPGGGLSPALNFDLKAQIASSKLVGGFSAPLASIAKIEAAVAVQQAKIAGGGLVSTGMLIGDRPDTAFKVDAAIVDGQIRQAQTRRLEQEQAAKETQTFYEVDPRFIENIAKDLVLAQPLEGGGVDITAPASNIFIIDRTGRASLAPEIENAIGGVPSNLPGNRENSSVTYHALIANEISLTLNPKELGTLQNANVQTNASTSETLLSLASGALPSWLTVGASLVGEDLLPGTYISSIKDGVALLSQPPLNPIKGGAISAVEPAQFFLPIPLMEKVAAAMVARQNLKFSGAIDFVGLDNIETTPDGFETGQTLLLSAGRTIQIAPGSLLTANASLFEIYAGGSSFTDDLSLALKPLGATETPVPLKLEHVAIVNKYPLDPTSISSGRIGITAPEIQLTDTLILGASDSSEVAIESKGAISILTASPSAANSDAANKLLVSLGFKDVKDLCIKAFKVGITSTSKTVSLNGVSLYSNDITLRGGDELRLSSVLIDPFDHLRDQSLAASAANKVTIDSNTTLGEDRSRLIPAAISTKIYSDNADVLIKNTEIGSVSDPAPDTETKTSFIANALKGDLLLNSSAINADTVAFGGKTVTVEGVNISPSDSDKGTITANATGNLSVGTEPASLPNTFKAYKIEFTAGGDMTLRDLVVDHVTRTKENSFSATAAGLLDLRRVGLAYAQNVALDAQTIVLQEVQFKAGAALKLTSKEGILSAPADRSQITRGWINILPNVMYGTYDLNKLSEYTGGSTQGIPAAKFPEVVKAVAAQTDPAKRADLSKITIAAKPAK